MGPTKQNPIGRIFTSLRAILFSLAYRLHTFHSRRAQIGIDFLKIFPYSLK